MTLNELVVFFQYFVLLFRDPVQRNLTLLLARIFLVVFEEDSTQLFANFNEILTENSAVKLRTDICLIFNLEDAKINVLLEFEILELLHLFPVVIQDNLIQVPVVEIFGVEN